MTTPRLWYLYHLAAHHNQPNTAGIAQERHAPGGWDLLWERGGHGQPPLKVLSECEAPLILHNVFGQVPGMPVQWLLRERPRHYIEKLVRILQRYDGPVIVYSGSPHNSPDWDHVAEVKAAEELAVAARIRGLLRPHPITVVLDALTECGDRAAECAAFVVALRGMGFRVGCEGALWDENARVFAPVLDVVMHMRSSLRRQVNDAGARKGVAPLSDKHEHIVWIDDPSSKDLLTHEAEARGVMAEGVPWTDDGFDFDAPVTRLKDFFQASAARPMSAAISAGLTAEQVGEIWGGGK